MESAGTVMVCTLFRVWREKVMALGVAGLGMGMRMGMGDMSLSSSISSSSLEEEWSREAFDERVGKEEEDGAMDGDGDSNAGV